MKTTYIFLVFTFILVSNSFSQENKERVVTTSGDTISNALSMGMQYLFPEFTQGTVYFSSRHTSTAFFNYNILLNEIHFIEPIALKEIGILTERNLLRNAKKLDLTGVDFVLIGRDFFFNTRRGIMYLVANYEIKLLQKNSIEISNETRIGAYGQPIQTASIESRSIVETDNLGYSSLNTETLNEYSRKTEYFLYKDGKLIPAKRRQFERTFPRIKDEIRNFVKENNTDFSNMDDIRALLSFSIENSKKK